MEESRKRRNPETTGSHSNITDWTEKNMAEAGQATLDTCKWKEIAAESTTEEKKKKTRKQKNLHMES